MKMPFGKHRGQAITEVPGAYLKWLLGNTDPLPDTRSAVEAELRRREDGAAAPAPATPPPAARRAPAPTAEPACDICKLPGSAQRPLVHAQCVADREEIPF